MTYFPEVHKLQVVSLGACIRGQSVPAFQPENEQGRFVQTVNSGDHWVCITNPFISQPHEVTSMTVRIQRCFLRPLVEAQPQ